MPIRIVLAEDHEDMRSSLRELIDQTPQMQVAATAQDCDQAMALAAELQPDVVIMNVGLPNLDGVEATRRLTDDLPNVKIIALTMNRNAQFAAQVMEAGADGFVVKDDAFEEIVNAIRKVVDGGQYLSTCVQMPT